jgi:NAD(P)-dependent dehydrogenase (short-subunit alcohol dehydrogenase family)
MGKFSLVGKTAIITGAGSGIGEAIATNFARAGAIVYMLEINTDKGEAVVEKINSKGGTAYCLPCDVSSQTEVRNTVEKVHKQGRIDILVNNAGIAHVGNVESTTEQELDRIYAVNIKGMYNCMHVCIPFMKKSGGGSILNMASVVSSVGIPDRFAYSMSKGAVLTMTYSVAMDYVKDNIRCNCISPARVHTPFVDGFLAANYPGKEKEMFQKLANTQPIGRMGKPEEIANLALFICSDEGAFLTGTDYPIDGGFIHLIDR